MATILKNVLAFTGLQVGTPALLPHGLNLDGRALVPNITMPETGPYTITVDATNVTITAVAASPGAAVDVYVEFIYSQEAVFDPTNDPPTEFPFVLQTGGDGASNAVLGPDRLQIAGRQSFSPSQPTSEGPSVQLVVGSVCLDPADYPEGTVSFGWRVLAGKGSAQDCIVSLHTLSTFSGFGGSGVRAAQIGVFEFTDRDFNATADEPRGLQCMSAPIFVDPSEPTIYEVRVAMKSNGAGAQNGQSAELYTADFEILPITAVPSPAGAGTGPGGSCLTPRPIGLNPAFQDETGASGPGATSVVLNNPVALADRAGQSGNVLIAEISPAYPLGVAGPATVTAPGGWILVDRGTGTRSGNNNFDLHVFYKVASGSEPNDYTFTWDVAHAGGCTALISNYEGADTSGGSPFCAGASVRKILETQEAADDFLTVETNVPFGGAQMHLAVAMEDPDGIEVDNFRNGGPYGGPLMFSELGLIAFPTGGEDSSLTTISGTMIPAGKSSVRFIGGTDETLVFYAAMCPACCADPGATPTVPTTSSAASVAATLSQAVSVPAGAAEGDVLLYAVMSRRVGASASAITNAEGLFSFNGRTDTAGGQGGAIPGTANQSRMNLYIEVLEPGDPIPVTRTFTSSTATIWAVSCMRIAGANIDANPNGRIVNNAVGLGSVPAVQSFLPGALKNGEILPPNLNQQLGLEPLIVNGPVAAVGPSSGFGDFAGQAATQELPVNSDNSLMVYVVWGPDPSSPASLQTPPDGMALEVSADGDAGGADFAHVAMFSEARDRGPADAKSQSIVSTAPTQDVTATAMVLAFGPVCND